MKVYLMQRDQDFDLQRPLPPQEPELTQDLEMDTLFNAMAGGDKFLFDMAKRAVLLGADELDTIRYRQDVLRDCLNNPAVIRDIYQILLEVIEKKRHRWMGIYGRSPSGILGSSVEMVQLFVGQLRKLRQIADQHASQFESEGFIRFFAMLDEELDDAYFAAVEEHLKRLRFRNGVLISATLGKGNEGAGHLLRKPNEETRGLIGRVFASQSRSYSFRIHPRDEHGARALADLQDRGINLVANALAQSADHIDSFFEVLRVELAFYIGCLNLAEQLAQWDEPVAFPVPAPASERRFSCRGLYDVCLALTLQGPVVGNDVQADGKDLVIITGANQGGKSTFLRSVGLAQVMMQCGMFVPAESFQASVCQGLFTHYRREEDASMTSGKLDEELSRMSGIADRLTANATVLFNESFAATNEREGSEIARQITRALVERRVRVFFVTHLYEFAHSWFRSNMSNTLFLRAQRQADGTRTFRLIEGEPLETSYGEDLYKSVFSTDDPIQSE
ncbi:MAG TPA: DNA mismatch repair protein MutS [Anaerolineae bacterium]|nr:DNA mismatch repair protein MutS [Anaerolineae bacterium]